MRVGEGGREEGREGERERGREGGRKGEGGRERGGESELEGERTLRRVQRTCFHDNFILLIESSVT